MLFPLITHRRNWLLVLHTCFECCQICLNLFLSVCLVQYFFSFHVFFIFSCRLLNFIRIFKANQFAATPVYVKFSCFCVYHFLNVIIRDKSENPFQWNNRSSGLLLSFLFYKLLKPELDSLMSFYYKRASLSPTKSFKSMNKLTYIHFMSLWKRSEECFYLTSHPAAFAR